MPPQTWEQPWSFGEFLATARALTKRDAIRADRAVGFRQYLGLVLLGRAVRDEQRRSVVHPADESDPLQFRQRGVHGGGAVLRRPGQQVQGRAQRIRGAVDVDARLVRGGQGGDRARRTLAIPDIHSSRRPGFRCCAIAGGPTPARGRPRWSNIGSTGLAISASSQRKEQAWEFVKFATGPVGQALIAESCLFVPVLRSALARRDSPRPTGGSATSPCLPRDRPFGRAAGHPGVGKGQCPDGPQLRARAARSRPATSLTGLSRAVDEVLRSP